MRWKVPPMWKDGQAWVIGGGPSMPGQFDVPDSVIQKVRNTKDPSFYSPYLKPIHDKHVIGVNAAFMLGDWIEMVIFGDKKFFNRYHKELADFPGLKISCNSKFDDKRIRWVRNLKKEKKMTGIADRSDSVCWNKNTGAAAISVAANAGAKQIILLGFDMNTDSKTGAQWWHTVYTKGNLARNKLPFSRHLRSFPDIAKDAKRRGIEILNASPNSAIEVFKKVNVKDVL